MYPPPTYSHRGATSTGPGLAIDIGAADEAEAWPVMKVDITGTCAVAIEGSHDQILWTAWEPSTGFTSSVAKRLELGVRFWRTNVISISGGVVTSSVGTAPRTRGGWGGANNATQQTNTTGQPGI